ncbi:oxidoreductase [Nocardiopsis terrae]|uniref:Aryl-alcohol dehydrogenase-like predicted oxidoreductase n=1 Tax=Nocardiopsis terrae TaxID=372655 RepID=A0ABR9HN83_9ACTN|nr:aldo/keto reductase [Nocardiopsis terrae]MBE1460490.1 aryl-alcohol dehydrogenase-like predicted oxidoreductase [Nocardiopsis terrae]GHC71727.1 oxidoreductase [Nocardiopsis terrae]
MTVLGMGTYRSRDAATSVSITASAGCPLIDTAPVYGGGSHQAAIAPVLREHPHLRLSTKVGYMTGGQARVALTNGALSQEEAALRHSIAPDYVRHQVAMSRTELRQRPDLVYLHNPEHHHQERGDLHQRLRSAFAALEELHASGAIGGYGVSTWSGFETRAFTVTDLLRLAEEAAGRPENGLRAIQLPVSMVKIAPVRQSLEGSGPIAQASQAGLEVWASAPFHGGELLPLITPKLAEAVQPGADPVEAALKVAASAPGLTGVLISTTNSRHYAQAAEAIREPVPDYRLKELCDLLDPPAR